MVRVKDLPTHGMIGPFSVFLYCAICGAECSSHRGDYFMLSPDQTMMCCDEPMILARKHTIISEVK